jgi:acid phosphatase
MSIVKAMSAVLALVALSLSLDGRPSFASGLPRPAHVIVIIEENKTLAQIDGDGSAPYINELARRGALFTNAHGVTHPSLPNYLALFSGLTNDNGDGCPATGISAVAPNLASELLAAHLTFAGYAESLPQPGSTVCAAGTYARKHAPWVAFSNVPVSAGKPFSTLPAYRKLPTVTFIVPDVDDDMHDGTIGEGDAWLKKHVESLTNWADSHDTLIILTWDEGYDDANTIPTILVGPMVRPGRYGRRIDHYNVLRTIEDMYGLAPTGAAVRVSPLVGCWR